MASFPLNAVANLSLSVALEVCILRAISQMGFYFDAGAGGQPPG